MFDSNFVFYYNPDTTAIINSDPPFIMRQKLNSIFVYQVISTIQNNIFSHRLLLQTASNVLFF